MTCVLLQSIKLAQRLSCYIPETDANRHTKITRRLQLTFIQEVNEVQNKNVKNTKNFMIPWYNGLKYICFKSQQPAFSDGSNNTNWTVLIKDI